MMISVAKKIGRATWTRGLARVGLGQGLVGLCFAPAQDRFGHHDRAVNDDAEIDRAERQQVGRDAW